MENIFGFEDSTASNPSTSNAEGWTKQSAWNYGQLGSNAGPSNEPSFPYVYGTNLNGNYGNGVNSMLTSPTYSIPNDGQAYLRFDKWICTENNFDAIALQFKVNGGSWNYFDPQIPGWYDGNPSYISSITNGWMAGDCNQDYFEDLDDNKTEEIIQTLLEDKFPTPGSAKNRKNTAPEKGKTTLIEVKNA